MEMSSSTQPKDPGVRFGLVTCFCMPIGSTRCCFLLFWGKKGTEQTWLAHGIPENWMYALVTQANWWQDSQVYIIIYPTNGLESRGVLWAEKWLSSHLPQLNDAGFTRVSVSLKLRPVQNLAWNLKATSRIDPPERKQGWLNQHKTIWMATG